MSTANDNDFLDDKDWRYFGLILEQLLDQNKAILEAVGDMRVNVARAPKLEADVSQLKQDMTVVKAAVTDVSRQVKDYEHRTVHLEASS